VLASGPVRWPVDPHQLSSALLAQASSYATAYSLEQWFSNGVRENAPWVTRISLSVFIMKFQPKF